jgi:hypothetical protein
MGNSLTIEDMKRIASEKGGWCLSDEYINQLTKLTWKCSEGHVWETIPKHIRRGTWCPVCARKSENRNSLGDTNLQDLKQRAKNKSGMCLSEKYINKTTKLLFKCSHGHIFETRPAEILKGQWCPYCAGKHKNSIEIMYEIAKERKGKCLSTTYKNVFTKLKWQCANGHEFEAIPKHVINGHWCPNCTVYLNEQRCRYILETLFDTIFIKDHNTLNGFELDGYNKELKLAFEYHGKQHYEHVDFFYSRGDMSLEGRRERDRLKENLCKELGIELLIIPYTVTPEDQVSFIAKELKKRGFTFKKAPSEITFVGYSFTNQQLEEIQEIAYSKGGKCLSHLYINVDTKLDFICKEGHFFSNTPYQIKIGQWCKTCSYQKMSERFRLDKTEMHEIAREKGWNCLSNEYKNARQKLKWECGKGHIFERSLSHVKEGRGCPICIRTKR